jgi:uncharacterized phage-like protein YoqJ
MREITLAFTGHRPSKLGKCYEFTKDSKGFAQMMAITSAIQRTILDIAERNKPTRLVIVTGGAQGVDQWAFWAARHIQRKELVSCEVHLVVAVPEWGQEEAWYSETSKEKYRTMLSLAGEVVHVPSIPGYGLHPKILDSGNEKRIYASKLQMRNEYMVDNCDLLIAVWDGSDGGTANAVHYAEYNNKDIHRIDPRDIIG